MSADERKRAAAIHAVDAHVRSGMALGLGTGSTAAHVVAELGRRLADGRLREIVGVPTSEATAALARASGVPLATLAERPALDVALDGADEIDPELDLLKGLGGAHLREKVVACASARMIVVADETKLVPRLGTSAPLPVEVIGFARAPVERRLASLGWEPALRMDGAAPFVTDEGNLVLDCRRDDWGDPERLAASVRAVPGVVEHGFFLGIAALAIVGTAAGVRTLSRPAAGA
jgi:ribose 5-phosphate isomerase A